MLRYINVSVLHVVATLLTRSTVKRG